MRIWLKTEQLSGQSTRPLRILHLALRLSDTALGWWVTGLGTFGLRGLTYWIRGRRWALWRNTNKRDLGETWVTTTDNIRRCRSEP